MSQADVIELLEKMDKPLSVGEIAKLLNDNQKKISKDLNKMLKYNEVIFEEIDRFMAMEKYNCKKRMRLWSANGDC
jgi:predicted Zn-ribbon and HTH transcriptional regulator